MKKGIKEVYDASNRNAKKPRFIYISIKVDAKRVDVNVHPTKNEVYLMEENVIIDTIKKQLYYEVADESLVP